MASPGGDSDDAQVVALLGDEETTGAFLQTLWGRQAGGCDVASLRDDAPVETIQATFDFLLGQAHVGLVIVTSTFADAIRPAVEAAKQRGPTVLEIPSAGAPPRATCVLYDPRPHQSGPTGSAWAAAPPTKPGCSPGLGAVADSLCGEDTVADGAAPPQKFDGDADVADDGAKGPPAVVTADVDACRRRIDDLVTALFRLVGLDAAAAAGGDGRSARAAEPSPRSKSFRLEVFNAATQELAEHMQARYGAWFFARALNRQRTRMVDVGAAYPFLGGLVLNFLDCCQALHDVESILTGMMLAQSFYRVRDCGAAANQAFDGDAPPRPPGEAAGASPLASAASASESTPRRRREYLKSAIQSHPVWADALFWRRALALLVRKQAEAKRGDNADDDVHDASACLGGDYGGALLASLRGAAGGGDSAAEVALWSQLGGVVHAMLEFGAQPDAVRTFVAVVCRDQHLPTAQREIIEDHIRHHAGGASARPV